MPKKKLTLSEMSEELRKASHRQDARDNEERQFKSDAKWIAYTAKHKFMID